MSGDSSRGRGGTYAAIGGLFVLSAAAAAYEIAPASVTPTVMADLAVGEAAAGWLVSVMYLVAVLASLPVGATLDRTDRRRAVVAAGLALLVAGVTGWLAADAGNYPALVASRLLGGLAYVAIWNAGANLAGEAVPAGLQATAVGSFTASAPAGFALGHFGAPHVAAAAGWPAVFPAFAAVGVAGLALFWWGAVRLGGAAGRVDSTAPPDRAAVRRLFRTRAVWLVCGFGFAGFALYLFLNSWLPTILGGRLSLSLAESGLLVALVPAVGIVARSGGGVLSDRAFAGRRRPVVLLAFGVAVPVVLGLAHVSRVVVAVPLLVVGGAAIHLSIGLAFTAVREVVPAGVRTTAVSLLTSVGLLGAFAGPLGAGLLVEWTGGFRAAFLAAALVGAAGAVLAFAVPEPADRVAASGR